MTPRSSSSLTAAMFAAAAMVCTPAVAGDGKAIYEKNCTVCHTAGVAGAPKLDDKADWATRTAQGIDVLNEHAIKGYTGKKGMMPPKGGAMSLSDDEVKAAVQYMVDQSK